MYSYLSLQFFYTLVSQVNITHILHYPLEKLCSEQCIVSSPYLPTALPLLWATAAGGQTCCGGA